MAKSDYEQWLPEIDKVQGDDNPLTVPYHVALREAVTAADFVQRYWEPSGQRPGLVRIKKRVPKATTGTIQSLVRAVQEAQTRVLMQVDPVVADLGERARFVADALESAIEFTLDDDVHEEADDKLAQIHEFHAQDGQRSDRLSQTLRDYAALADELRDRIAEEDTDFDPKLIDEARTLANKLATAARLPPAKTEATDKTRQATVVRNRLLRLLAQQVSNVRRGASHVFGEHPEIVREVTSAYERRRRAEARRKKKTETPPGP